MNPLRKSATIALAVGVLATAGCKTVGPDYIRPEVSLPPAYRDAPTQTAASLADLPWWAVFDDPVLQGLIAQTLANNLDLQVSVARIAQARALVGVSASQSKPQLGYRGNVGGESTLSPTDDGPDSVTFGSIGAALDFAWEFDLWGRIKRSNQAAEASLLQQEEIRRGILLSLTSEVAEGYFRLLELDREIAIAQESTRTYGATFDLFNQRFEAGRDSRLPVERTRANRDASEARIAEIRRRIAVQENALSVLMGAPPGPIARGRALEAQALPATPVGATTDLLQRRPDIRAAEQGMMRANAEMGVAVANKFPRLGLSALAGLVGASVSGDSEGFGVGSLGLALSGPIFTGGRLDEIYNNRKAYWDETIAEYRKTALVALGETADALAAQTTLGARRAALERQVASLRRSVDLAQTRYDTGRAGYFEVLEAQQQLFPAEDALAQTQRDQLIAVVNLYKALGGGWRLTDDQWTKPQDVAAAGG
jgi:multidrug efflux system outer membrane protein